MAQAGYYGLKEVYYFLFQAQNRTASATRPTRPLSPSAPANAVMFPTTSRCRKGTADPNKICSITPTASNLTPKSMTMCKKSPACPNIFFNISIIFPPEDWKNSSLVFTRICVALKTDIKIGAPGGT